MKATATAFALMVLGLLSASCCAEGQAPDSILQRADSTARVLLTHRTCLNHLFQKAGWWNSANIMEALIDFHRLTGRDFKATLKRIYRKNVNLKRGKFITVYAFDDNEWWALAWLKAYEITGEERYRRVAEGIFRHTVKHSWNNVCGGGVRWSNREQYKNAITNELFMQLAARLGITARDSAEKAFYRNWAIKDWNWFKNSGMINSGWMINDGLNTNCVNNNQPTWTYNQGVILGALKDLYQLTSDTDYIHEARLLALASIKKLANKEGILTEPGDNKGGHDKSQFKGIYIRYLAALNVILKDKGIKNFIQHNADYAWQHARSKEGFFDFYWNGPFTEWSGPAMGSALDLMNAALMQQ